MQGLSILCQNSWSSYKMVARMNFDKLRIRSSRGMKRGFNHLKIRYFKEIKRLSIKLKGLVLFFIIRNRLKIYKQKL